MAKDPLSSSESASWQKPENVINPKPNKKHVIRKFRKQSQISIVEFNTPTAQIMTISNLGVVDGFVTFFQADDAC